MQVYVQDYGVIDFRPEEVYRFDGRTDMTQLRGSIRTNSNNDWVKHDYWYNLRDVLVAHSNELNLVIGLPVLTRADLDREQQQENLLCNRCGKPLSECGEDSCVDEQNNLVEKIIGLKEGKLLVCGVHTKPGGVSWSEFYQFLKDVKVIDLNAPTKWVAGEGVKLEEQADGSIVVSLVDEDHAFSQWQASIDVDNNNNKMTTLKLDLEITEACDLAIYKGDDNNLYMFNSSGDLVTSAELENDVVWDFAIGTFKLNDDRIITQTQEYHDKYYVCKNCEDTVIDENWGEQGGGTYFTAENLKQAYDTFTDELQAAEAADDTDIEEEIQRVLSAMKELDLLNRQEADVYQWLVTILGNLHKIQKEI